MTDINDLIKKKLEKFSPEVFQLAMEAIKLSSTGLPEPSVTDHLANVVRQILKKKESNE